MKNQDKKWERSTESAPINNPFVFFFELTQATVSYPPDPIATAWSCPGFVDRFVKSAQRKNILLSFKGAYSVFGMIGPFYLKGGSHRNY